MKTTADILEKLMRRGEIWRGHSQRFASAQSVKTGHTELDPLLVNQGWPTASLIEVCQPTQYGYCEWLLLTPALVHMQSLYAGYIVLLNPPALPFCQGLIQSGINLDSLLVLRTRNKQEFVTSFVELARDGSCHCLLAWQPLPPLTYSELRKCLLACHEGQGLYVIFSDSRSLQQNSPASLRLTTTLNDNSLNVAVYKQKGQLQSQQHKTASIPFPEEWLEHFANHDQPSHRFQHPPTP